jgi:hypothetical protein
MRKLLEEASDSCRPFVIREPRADKRHPVHGI